MLAGVCSRLVVGFRLTRDGVKNKYKVKDVNPITQTHHKIRKSNSKKKKMKNVQLGGCDSSVGITTRYGLGGPGIDSRWGLDFPHSSRPALGPIQPPVKWIPWVKPAAGWP
jgi:hypothetical protein